MIVKTNTHGTITIKAAEVVAVGDNGQLELLDQNGKALAIFPDGEWSVAFHEEVEEQF